MSGTYSFIYTGFSGRALILLLPGRFTTDGPAHDRQSLPGNSSSLSSWHIHFPDRDYRIAGTLTALSGLYVDHVDQYDRTQQTIRFTGVAEQWGGFGHR
jgi:hypothetical protein